MLVCSSEEHEGMVLLPPIEGQSGLFVLFCRPPPPRPPPSPAASRSLPAAVTDWNVGEGGREGSDRMLCGRLRFEEQGPNFSSMLHKF